MMFTWLTIAYLVINFAWSVLGMTTYYRYIRAKNQATQALKKQMRTSPNLKKIAHQAWCEAAQKGYDNYFYTTGHRDYLQDQSPYKESNQ